MMGHTVHPMRWVVYSKLNQLRKLCKGLREPEKSIAESLLIHVHKNISALNYANPLPREIENNMLFLMLMEEKKRRGLIIDDHTLLVFSIMVRGLKEKDERNFY